MKAIRDILKQLALQLDLNIAMCDMIESLEKRVTKLEAQSTSQKATLGSLSTQVSEFMYKMASDSYEARKGAKRP